MLLDDVQLHERCTHPVGEPAGNKDVNRSSPYEVVFDNDRCSKEREGYRECREFPEQGNIGGEPDETGEQVKDFSGQSVDENPAVFGNALVRIVQWRIFIGIQMPVGLVGEPPFQRGLRQGGSPPDLDKLADIGGDQVLGRARKGNDADYTDLPERGLGIVFFQCTEEILVPGNHFQGQLDFDQIQGQYDEAVKNADFSTRPLDAEGGEGGNAF